ncbi:MAG: lipoate--protein ligase family protein [Chloroflexi bacterium]|nr:lipoate--protein ligase family protein [Chloroflexota bacterium]
MQLFHLKHVPWLLSQLIYHAQARLGLEGINILAPSEPYFCIGYHQDLLQEVDVAFCQEHGIPIFRREVGGGAVYLDGNQLFYQLILHKDNPLAQGDKATLYQRFLQPVADAYGDLGVPARYRPINDIVTAEGRKISGNGAATIGDCLVLVGNLIADFDYETMSRVLRVPDEKYRDKVFKSMRENLTTLRRETGHLPAWDEMAFPLIRRFEQVLGPLDTAELPQVVYEQVEILKPQFLSEEWLYKKGRQRPGREVKIASGVNVVQRLHKAPGGLLRATMETDENRLHSVSLSGDFFCYPEDAISQLEAALEGATLEQVQGIVADFYARGGVETPGVTAEDWLRVLLG